MLTVPAQLLNRRAPNCLTPCTFHIDEDSAQLLDVNRQSMKVCHIITCTVHKERAKIR